MLRLLSFILGIVAIQARIFNNPILGTGNYTQPGAIKVNGTYYIATTNMNYTQSLKFAIHESTDLANWKLAGYIFDETNYPLWANINGAFFGAKIHKVGTDYHVYFNAVMDNNFHGLGVAVASHPLGPYTATDRPLFSEPLYYAHYPTIASDNGNLYLLTDRNGDSINGRQLDSDGLSFASDQNFQLLQFNLTWEYYNVQAPWYMRRGDYHYVIYTGSVNCNTTSIGVARSKSIFGPYEKLETPILVANDDFIDPGFASVIRDLDDKSDVIVFQTHRASEACGSQYDIALASLRWDEDSWPYISDF